MRRRAAHEEMLGHEELEPQLPAKEEREVAIKARAGKVGADAGCSALSRRQGREQQQQLQQQRQ